MAASAKPIESDARTVRRATAADLPTLTPMLVRTFMDDPVAVWACKWERLRPKMLEGMYTARLRQLLAHQEVWTNPGRSSAALWVPPDRWKTTLRQDAALIRSFLDPRLMARLPLLAVGLSGVQRKHPRTPPHWYLSLLGTDPDLQGRGFGSAVLQPVLEQCDGDGVGAYLESSKPRNLDFYARYGFRITGELQLPLGPTMWSMWRDPRP
jgi:ribosomal protein S18 acetylase RimI-like enzyme